MQMTKSRDLAGGVAAESWGSGGIAPSACEPRQNSRVRSHSLTIRYFSSALPTGLCGTNTMLFRPAHKSVKGFKRLGSSKIPVIIRVEHYLHLRYGSKHRTPVVTP